MDFPDVCRLEFQFWLYHLQRLVLFEPEFPKLMTGLLGVNVMHIKTVPAYDRPHPQKREIFVLVT